MKQLQQIQQEIGDWSEKQFGNNISKVTGFPMGSQNALTGIVEEVGELNHVTICRHQGRRGYGDKAKYEADRNDALADILVFLCDYASREGVDLLTVLNETWDKVVSKRTLQNWEEHSHETKPTEEQTGQGWKEPTQVYDQGPYGSSAGFAVANALEKARPVTVPYAFETPVRFCSKCKLTLHENNATGLCSHCHKPTI